MENIVKRQLETLHCQAVPLVTRDKFMGRGLVVRMTLTSSTQELLEKNNDKTMYKYCKVRTRDKQLTNLL